MDSPNQVQIAALRGGCLHFFCYLGPAVLVSVGYMDPGNWATDLEGGVRFGYQLLWVLVLSNLLALLLQNLCARLGVVSGRDLAEACRENYQRPVVLCLWILCELAIIACDIAEVIGSAIALNLLHHPRSCDGRSDDHQRHHQQNSQQQVAAVALPPGRRHR